MDLGVEVPESAAFIRLLIKNIMRPGDKNNLSTEHLPYGCLNKKKKSLYFNFYLISSTTLDYWTAVELRVFDVQEIPFGQCCPSVPSTRVIAPLDTSKVFGLPAIHRLLNHPVRPQALRRAADHAGDDGAAGDLAITAHFIALSQALLLGGTQVLPGLEEVTQCDMHRLIGLQLPCDEILLAIIFQTHATHCRGGSCVDGGNILGGTFEHLHLFDVILDPLDGVSIDVIANVNLLPPDHLCPDNDV